MVFISYRESGLPDSDRMRTGFQIAQDSFSRAVERAPTEEVAYHYEECFLNAIQVAGLILNVPPDELAPETAAEIAAFSFFNAAADVLLEIGEDGEIEQFNAVAQEVYGSGEIFPECSLAPFDTTFNYSGLPQEHQIIAAASIVNHARHWCMDDDVETKQNVYAFLKSKADTVRASQLPSTLRQDMGMSMQALGMSLWTNPLSGPQPIVS